MKHLRNLGLTKTASYLATIDSKNRIGHHNYVIERMMLNQEKALCDKTSKELEIFDTQVCDYLMKLDEK